MKHRTSEELEEGLDHIGRSPQDEGVLQLIVRRPRTDEREVLKESVLDLVEGLIGDNWKTKGSSLTADGSAHVDLQVTVMNSRVIDLVAGEKDRWPLAGDQLFIDIDLSENNVPPGTQLVIGDAVIEVTEQPHTGCQKFVERFGVDAMKWVNSPLGKSLHLRGINARVIQPGRIRTGEIVRIP